MPINERSSRVLAALVREYIACGEPVPSSLLVNAAGLGVSSATVRSILAQLEEEGYVQQPHTSVCFGFSFERFCHRKRSPMPYLHLPFAAFKFPDTCHFTGPIVMSV